MAIDEELLKRAKSGPGDDALQAARTILVAAWDIAYGSGYTANRPHLRDLMCNIAEVLTEIEDFGGFKHSDLAQDVCAPRPRNGKDDMMQLLGYAWDVARNPQHKQSWRMRFLMNVLFLVANQKCQ